MTEREDKGKDMNRIVEQTTTTLQEVERNLDALRADVQALVGRAPPPSSAHPAFGALAAPAGASLFRGGPLFAGPPASPQLVPQPFGFGGAWAGLGAAGPATTVPEPVRSAREIRGLPPTHLTPTVCLVDQGDEYALWADLPGVKKEDLDILCGDHTVTITAESRLDVEDGVLLLAERGPVRYRRTVALPRDVQTGQVKASVKDGVLTLRIPKKTPGSGPRRVDVAFG